MQVVDPCDLFDQCRGPLLHSSTGTKHGTEDGGNGISVATDAGGHAQGIETVQPCAGHALGKGTPMMETPRSNNAGRPSS